MGKVHRPCHAIPPALCTAGTPKACRGAPACPWQARFSRQPRQAHPLVLARGARTGRRGIVSGANAPPEPSLVPLNRALVSLDDDAGPEGHAAGADAVRLDRLFEPVGEEDRTTGIEETIAPQVFADGRNGCAHR